MVCLAPNGEKSQKCEKIIVRCLFLRSLSGKEGFIMANLDVRFAAKAASVPFWKIGEVLGVSEVTIIRRLRKELSPEQKRIYFDAIKKIASDRAKAELEKVKEEE